jgi:hypothetical protein
MNVHSLPIPEFQRSLELSSAALSQVGFALVIGPQGRVYSVASIISDRHLTETESDYLQANRTGILFALGLQCLRLALYPTLVRAKAFLRIGLLFRKEGLSLHSGNT